MILFDSLGDTDEVRVHFVKESSELGFFWVEARRTAVVPAAVVFESSKRCNKMPTEAESRKKKGLLSKLSCN
jgi:hypothetical protein